MTEKLPRKLIYELDSMAAKLITAEPEERARLLTHLIRQEESGNVPLSALVAMTEGELNAVSLYAVGALGRNGQPQAVTHLVRLLQSHQEESPMLLESIVDALGETGDSTASPVLLELLGLQASLDSLLKRAQAWLGQFSALAPLFKRALEQEKKRRSNREMLLLPVIRALGKIKDPQASAKLAPYLEHSDALVRWHTIQNLMHSGHKEFREPLRQLAQHDESDLVREMAAIAVDNLTPAEP